MGNHDRKYAPWLSRALIALLCVILQLSIAVTDAETAQTGDINDDGIVNTKDVIIALRVSAGLESAGEGVSVNADVDGDSRIGMAEAVYAMQWAAGYRPTGVVINEFLATNGGGLEDEDGDTSDWIELHNRGTVAVDLEGWVLADGSGSAWTFPSITVGPGEFLVVFASGKDRKPTPVTVTEGVSNLHTHFQLAQDGEYLALADSGGVIGNANLFGSGYPGQVTDVSYGRSAAGRGWRYHATPTPGSANAGDVYEGIIADTTFSVDRGFYTDPFELAISTETAGATIRYTLDGSSPDPGHGSVYLDPIPINGTAIVRAAAFRSGWRPSNIDTQTYIFVADVVSQSRDGQAPSPVWPTGTVNDQVFNYGMDPDVVGDQRYADLMDDALLSIPSVSLVTDLENLFDPQTGIYVNAIKDGPDWERPVSMELINPDGSEGFQIDAGMRIRGGYSRQPSNPKHAFRLFFRQEYGDGKLRFPLFGDEGADRFDKIDLRTSMNYAWSFGGSRLNTMVRDAFNRDTQRDMGQPYTRSRYYHLYINGVYWGLFQTQERSEARYAETYSGGDKDDYDVVKVDSGLTITPWGYTWRPYNMIATDGNLDAWNRLWDVANAGFVTDEPYYRAQGLNVDGTRNPLCEILLDVDNLIDYMLIIFYGGNLDAPVTWFGSDNNPNNVYVIYNRNNPDGFKSFVHDAEHTLLVGNIHTAENEIYRDRTGPLPAGSNRAHFNPQWLHQQLAAHPEYRVRFADRSHRYFFNNGLLTPDVSTARFMARKEEIDLAIIAESARWGDQSSYLPRTRDDDWLWAINGIVNEWFPQRSNIVLEQLRAKDLYPDTDAPVFSLNGVYQHGGHISAGGVLTMANPNGSGTIYYTLDGTDPRMRTSQGTSTTLVSEDGEKRVLVPTGDIGTAWRGGTSFDDRAWTVTFGGVGFDTSTDYDAYIAMDVEGQMYGVRTSCYIRDSFVILPGGVDDLNILTLRIRYDDGFVAYINGVKVAEHYAPYSPQWDSAATGLTGDTTSFRYFDISSSVGALRAGTNVLAIHALNYGAESSDFLISAELVASDPAGPSGSAVAYASPLPLPATTHVSARVLDEDAWSALNEATYVLPVVAENLRVTEIMYHPQALPSGHPDAEFVELQNVGTQTINLVKTRFTEGIHFTFPNIQLGPGDAVVVVKDQAAFAQQYPAFTGTTAGEYTGSLANDGERIRLEDPTGAAILDFRYRDGWYPITDGNGFSLTSIDPDSADTGLWGTKEGWRPSTFAGGSPGGDDESILPDPGTILINEVLSHSHMENPDWIELLNTGSEPVNIGGWYLSDDGSDLMKYEIAAGTVVPATGYTVFYEDADFGVAFALSENGEAVYLSSASNGTLTGYREQEDFGASETNVAFGRYEKSGGTVNFVAMQENTPGADNADPKVGPIVISEVMYHPMSGDENEEYIELYNITGSEVILQEYDGDKDETVAWQFTDGIAFTFPLGTRIPANGHLLVVKDPASFSAAYTAPGGVTVLGPYDGQLSNGGERLQIGMPGDVNTLGERQYLRIDRVNYDDEAPWPTGADGAGSSLTRMHLEEYGNDVINWSAASPTPGS